MAAAEQALPLTSGSDVEHGDNTPDKQFPHEDPEFAAHFSCSQDTEVVDSMTYSLPWFKTWWVIVVLKGTVFDNSGLWLNMGKLLLVAIIVACSAYNFIQDPGLLDTSKFGNVAAVLTLFVSLMLSFFLACSVQRWLQSVDGFEALFNSITMLSMQLHALGANRERSDQCLRYGVMSAHFLVYELACLKMDPETQREAEIAMWNKFTHPSNTQLYSRILPEEKALLENIPTERYGYMWLWVGSLMGRMALDGDVPGMATPTYGRIMNLAQHAQEGIRTVRSAVIIQMPFIYVHLLAVLVHVNCLLMAINLGLSMGVAYHGLRQYLDHYYYDDDSLSDAQVTPMTTQIQSIIVEAVKGIVGPLLYQAFFEIGIAVSSPFSSSEAGVAVDRLVAQIECELEANNRLADKPPAWDPPHFKQPAALTK